ncbi:MAG: peptidoglycan DD-metalloendopeptidase family protein [Vicinamibacterales bacterium]
MLRPLPVLIILAAASGAACARQDAGPRASAAVTDVLLRAENAVIEAKVPRHGTLDSILRHHELSADLVNAAVQSARAVFNPRQIRADRPYRLVMSFDGFLREFEYEIDADRFLRIINRDAAHPEVLDAEVLPFEKQSSVVAIRGDIDAEHPSLIAAMGETGENVQLAMALADVFGGQIDFNSDLQPGDRFEVLFEKSTREGQFAGYGAILGATFIADGRQHQAFRWTHPDTGKAAYYDEEGRSLKRFFLVSPLKFEPRITSRFSKRRLHPVLNRVRAHRGVDYGAPHGAAVVAVADGTVVSAGWAGAGGRQIRLRHAGGIETYYLHLSSFARGIRAGSKVDQGDMIGRVGSTGTATGPHLHFALRKNHVFVDPVAERRRQPPGEPIPSTLLAAFRSARDGMLQRIDKTMLADAARNPIDAVSAAQ